MWSLLQLLVAMLLVSVHWWLRHSLEEHSYCKQTGTSHNRLRLLLRAPALRLLSGQKPCTGPVLTLRFGPLSGPCSAGGQQVSKALGLFAPASLVRGDQTATTSRRHWVPKAQGGNLSLLLQADGPSLRGPDPFSTQVASEE